MFVRFEPQFDQQPQKRRVSIHIWASETNMAHARSEMATDTIGQMKAQWNAMGPTITSAKISRTVAIIVTESLRSGFLENRISGGSMTSATEL